MTRNAFRAARRRLLLGIGLAYAGPVLAYTALRPLLGHPKGWIELVDDFAPWLYAPAPATVLASMVLSSPALGLAGAGLCAAFAARWGTRFLPSKSDAAPADLTLMAFNVLAWRRDASEIACAIERAAPDIVAIQELGPRPLAQLILALRDRLPHVAAHAVPDSSAIATFSRFPIVDAEPLMLSAGGGHWCQRLTIDAPGGPLTLLNVHTKIPRLGPSRWQLGPFNVPGSFHTERRLREVEVLCRLLDSLDGPVLALGDFNMTERSEDHARIARRLIDAYRVAGWGLGHTFPATLVLSSSLPLPFPALRLDHVWHSRHFQAVAARVGPNAGSDHRSLIVRVARASNQS